MELQQKDYTVAINPATANRVIEVPIKIIAEDETTDDSKIIITRLSTSADTLKVEKAVEVTEGNNSDFEYFEAEYDEVQDEYIVRVKEDVDSVNIRITAKSEYARITCKGQNGTGQLMMRDIALEGKRTYVNYSIKSEAGNITKDYLIRVVKSSENANLKSIEVNDEEITPDENGIYVAYVKGGTETANVVITAESDVAKTKISGEATPDSGNKVLTTVVKTPENENTYTVTILSEYGNKTEHTLKIIKQTNIVGKITTENLEGKYKSIITVYKTSDTRAEDDELNPRKITSQFETEDDGTFNIVVQDVEKYDIVVTKPGYLSYRLTEIEVEKCKVSEVKEHKLLAGNVVKYTELKQVNENGEVDQNTEQVKIEQIEVQDLVALNDNFGVEITDANKAEYGIYDFNEDGIIDKKDRNILKANMNKKAETKIWVDPTKVIGTTVVGSLRLVSPACGSYVLPMASEYVVTSPYGERVHPITGEVKMHRGIDMAGPHHTEILAIADGEVTFAGEQSGYGYCVEIKHVVDGETIYSFYAHLAQINVKEGEHVLQGQVIGLEGGMPGEAGAGTSTGPHLHFEIRTASGTHNDIDPNLIFKI